MANATTTMGNQSAARTSTQEGFGRFDFVKHAPLMGGISLFLMIASVVLVFTKGLNYGIDFAGGTEVQVRFEKPVEINALRAAVESTGAQNPSVQSFGSDREFLIRLELPEGKTEKETNDMVNANVLKVRESLKSQFGLQDEGVLRVDSVGPQVGSELKRNGTWAAIFAFLVILAYVWVRFDIAYAPGAVICLIHDAVVTIGVFALLGREFNVQIMAAVLTLIGYSLNDTIVTFDRIRETLPEAREKGMRYIINKAINDMMGRTILTAGATMLAVLGLFFFGGGVISEIAFTLIIGIVVGVYSSIYVAAPLILVMQKLQKSSIKA